MLNLPKNILAPVLNEANYFKNIAVLFALRVINELIISQNIRINDGHKSFQHLIHINMFDFVGAILLLVMMSAE